MSSFLGWTSDWTMTICLPLVLHLWWKGLLRNEVQDNSFRLTLTCLLSMLNYMLADSHHVLCYQQILKGGSHILVKFLLGLFLHWHELLTWLEFCETPCALEDYFCNWRICDTLSMNKAARLYAFSDVWSNYFCAWKILYKMSTYVGSHLNELSCVWWESCYH